LFQQRDDMVDKESPRYMRTSLGKHCYTEKGELRYERNIEISGNNKEDVRESLKYLSARLL
jgi:hypothetical protein